MKKIIPFIIAALLAIGLAACSDDKDEYDSRFGEVYEYVKNQEMRLFSSGDNHFGYNELCWITKEGGGKELYFHLSEMVGYCHDIPQELNKLTIPLEGIKVKVSGIAYRSKNTYSYIFEDVSVEFCFTDFSVIEE